MQSEAGRFEERNYSESLSIFFESNKALLVGIAKRSLEVLNFKGDIVEQAKDIIQDLFVELSKNDKLELSRNEAEIWAFLRLVIRRKARATVSLKTNSQTWPIEEIGALSDNGVSHFELRKLVEQILASEKITDEHRKLLTLRFINELSYQEIKQFMKYPVTVEAIASKVKTAIRKLRDQFPGLIIAKPIGIRVNKLK